MNDTYKAFFCTSLGETFNLFGSKKVTRVPGGWVYETFYRNKNGEVSTATSCFIPLSDEFQENIEDEDFK